MCGVLLAALQQTTEELCCHDGDYKEGMLAMFHCYTHNLHVQSTLTYLLAFVVVFGLGLKCTRPLKFVPNCFVDWN
ncbi:hypothetical protein Y032_0182g886 [Ancylostoma ceylanicum]|uniref:Uncharacterized protein n=1 Tax=Ancylostoma ceylanicum TaxID=53326 RepID=A0A016SRT2_9BILA|nr:hypothetical protein Y032_0182g886 [Ancylostoma ceylanicum]